MCQFCQCLICKGTASMRCHSAYIRPERSLRAPTSKMCGKACGKTYWHIKLPHIWRFFVEVPLGFRGLSVRTTSTRFCYAFFATRWFSSLCEGSAYIALPRYWKNLPPLEECVTASVCHLAPGKHIQHSQLEAPAQVYWLLVGVERC